MQTGSLRILRLKDRRSPQTTATDLELFAGIRAKFASVAKERREKRANARENVFEARGTLADGGTGKRGRLSSTGVRKFTD